ncbi:MAG: nucleotidyltransferase family protein [Halobacteriales archaeon]
METALSVRTGTNIRSVLEDHPVRLAILFGSHATGRAHEESDVDLAVELDGLEPGSPGFNDAFFGLSADLSETLGTDDVDLLDVHMLSPGIAKAVFDDGVLLLRSSERAEELRAELVATADDRTPRERLDEAIRRIDDHLA